MLNVDDLDAFGYWEMVDAYLTKEQSIGEMVKDYNTTAGNEKNPRLYEGLIYEEFYEWETEEGGPVNELKELADLLYVVYGYAWSRGWDLDEAVRRVHQNNMVRMFQSDGTIKRRADGKIEKNTETPKVKLDDLV